MPVFSKTSKRILATVHPDIQDVMNYVVARWDCKVLWGLRTIKEQQVLYAQGRTTPGPIVTNADGITKLSNHQRTVIVAGKSYGCAVDIAPFPVDWKDTERFYAFGGYVLGIAAVLGIRLRWGGDWDMDRDLRDQKLYDLPHFEIVLD